MRLVDCFIDTFLYLRELGRRVGTESPAYDDVRGKLVQLFAESRRTALANGFSEEIYTAAKYAMVAYADEMILCSAWAHKTQWQRDTLQRLYFDATNLGAGFYQKLNELNKFGPDREVREVYSLCLGLGFRGMYFSNADRQKYEEIKSFNLAVLLPEEAQRNIDTALLFPSSYGESIKRIKGDYRPRFNVIPYVIAAPIVIVAGVALYNSLSISGTLTAIASMVN